MAMSVSVLLPLWLAGLVGMARAEPRLLGAFPLPHAGFSTLYNVSRPGDARPVLHLLVSSFNGVPFSTDRVFVVKDVGSRLANVSAVRPLEVTQHTTWPNEVSGLPESVLGCQAVAIPGGFLVPSKTHGAIELLNITGPDFPTPTSITDPSGDWFFHRVLWQDFNQDGRLDALTCRAQKPLIGPARGQLLWLENPGQGREAQVWKEHVLAQGPDIFFRLASLPTSGGARLAILTAGFFSSSLAVYWSETEDWSQTGQVKSRALDTSIGEVFDVQVADLNQDGGLDLLVTCNSPTNGSVYAYVIPSDFRTGTFERHLLASGFKPRKSGMGKGAPGAAVVLTFPGRGSKPSLLLSGDDDGRAYVISPRSSQPNDWTYVTTPFADVGEGTVGQLSAADVNGDGVYEIFVPEYSAGRLSVYSLQ